MRLRAGLLIAVLTVAGCLAGMSGSARADAEREAYETAIRPLLETYCFSCHGPDTQIAGLGLHVYPDEASILADREVWEHVFQRVDKRLMPPPGMEQPTDAERAKLLDWLQATLYSVDCELPANPGRVTMRRLNRSEYDNSIRDLIGLDLNLAADFPSDDVGYGFDNIGDVLSLPPLLMEKYLDAAARAADAAIVAESPLGPLQRFQAEDAELQGGRAEGGFARFSSSGAASVAVELPREGTYRLRARAYGDQAGPEAAKIGFRLGDRQVAEVAVPARRDEPKVYEVQVTLPAGRHRLGAAFINDYYRPEAQDPNQRDRNLHLDWFELQGPESPARELPESHRRIVVARPNNHSDKAWRQAAREVIEPFGQRAWRRPLSDAEIEKLVDYVLLVKDDGDTFEAGIQLAVQAMLVSPHFLFRVELERPSPQPGVGAKLSSWEIASRLSYFLWSSTPDDELLRLAAADALHDPELLGAQVYRMLQDPKARALTDGFASQWLQLRNLDTVSPDPEQFPTFDEGLREAMRTETELFFEAVVADDLTVLTFLGADFTFLNERLAKHYGIDGVDGDRFRRVELAGTAARQRGGVLMQASVLTVTSNPTRTSPVKRGKYVLENILGTPPPEPPATVPPLDEAPEAILEGTLRERMEQHREDPNCAVCHIEMDAIGFGFENYDPIGAWRTADGPHAIDPAGELPGGRSFATPAELREILAWQQELFVRCLAEKLMTYALGRGLEFYDRCAIDGIVATAEAQNHRFSALVSAIVTSDPFLRRSPDEDTP